MVTRGVIQEYLTILQILVQWGQSKISNNLTNAATLMIRIIQKYLYQKSTFWTSSFTVDKYVNLRVRLNGCESS